MVLNFGNFFFDIQIDFPKNRYKNVKYLNLVCEPKPEFGLVSIFCTKTDNVVFQFATSECGLLCG